MSYVIHPGAVLILSSSDFLELVAHGCDQLPGSIVTVVADDAPPGEISVVKDEEPEEPPRTLGDGRGP